MGIVSDLYVNNTDAFASIFNAGYIGNTISVSSTPTAIQIDATGLQILNKARNTFTRVGLGFFTCRGRDPVKQVDEFTKKISKSLYDIVWVYLGQ